MKGEITWAILSGHPAGTARAVRLVFGLLCGLCLALPLSLRAADRVALVIGNGAYQHGNPLRNPTADATDVAAALKQCGFELIGGKAQTDLSQEGMAGALTGFRNAAAESKVALFFFAGHGLEVGGENYLVPVDAQVEKEYQVKYRTLALTEVLEAMAGDEERLKIVILDCCRVNPLGRGWGRADAAGLGVPKFTPGGTILLFAAAPGQVAKDGEGNNSPFSGILKTEVLRPGLEIYQVFQRVGAEVKRGTGGQEPWMNSSFYGSFAFVPGSGANPGSGGVGGMVPAPSPLATITEPARTGPGDATKERPFANSLGMKFVPVVNYTDGSRVLFSIWETRVQDYAAYAAKNPGVNLEWKDYEYEGHGQGPDHPVVNVNWEDAKAFCAWLTESERAAGQIGPKDEYRLPTDQEWSHAVGIGDREDANASPEEKNSKIEGVYPWGTSWPPPKGAGNYRVSDDDGYAFTAPVGSYRANDKGLYDLGGNVWEWCEDWYDPSTQGSRVLRGASWSYFFHPVFLLSSVRIFSVPDPRVSHIGFRCVLVVGSGG